MRWLATVAVVIAVLVLWTAHPSFLFDGPSGSREPASASASGLGAAASRLACVDLARAVQELDKSLDEGTLTLRTCESVLRPADGRGFHLATNRISGAEAPTAAIESLFRARLRLRARIKSFGPALANDEPCLRALREAMHDGRALEESLAEAAMEFPDEDQEGQPDPLQGGAPYMMVAPGSAPFALRPGDVVLSRESAFMSSALTALVGESGDFSHVAIYYEDPASGEKWLIGSHVEVGAIARKLDDDLSGGKARVAVYRFADAKLAARAAAAAFRNVRAYQNAHDDENMPYDFTMDAASEVSVFATELVARAFAEVGGPSLPLYPSRLAAHNRVLLDRLGVKTSRAFLPADFDLDPRFDLVAEWRELGRVNAIHMHDEVLAAMRAWMQDDGYTPRQEPASGGLKQAVSRRLSRWPVFSVLLEDESPLDLDGRLVGMVTALDETGEALFADLDSANQASLRASGHWLSSVEMRAELERFRRDDRKAFDLYQKTKDYDLLAKKPQFHLLFR